jgi:hypothetical protein
LDKGQQRYDMDRKLVIEMFGNGTRAAKAFALFIALGMMIGGLGILSYAGIPELPTAVADSQPTAVADSSESPHVSNIPYTGVARTVLWEQFTNARCGHCPATEGAVLPALYEYGYQLVAPVLPHVWWPAANDSVWLYSNVDVIERTDYYGDVTGVPYCVCDGFHVWSEEYNKTFAYREYFDKALGELSRLTIETTGNLTAETVSAVVEAHEIIPPGANLSIRFAFWENNIDVIGRFGYKGQLFTTYHWAMWDTLPDSTGEPVFPAGANPGDKMWFNRSFFIDPGPGSGYGGAGMGGMVADELGVTVWIQNDDTHQVEQACLEDFEPDPPVPTHDIAVKGLHVDDNPCYFNMSPPNKVIANRTVPVNGTVLNWGASNETDIEVNFIVNGSVEQTQSIPFLQAGFGQRVSFNWTVPIIVGNCTVAIQATPVAGDVNATNNIHEKTVWVERPLDLWISPDNLDLQVWEGLTTVDGMMMGNNGVDDLYYDVDVGELTEIVGSWDLFSALIPGISCGNIYNVTTPTTLVEYKMWMDVPLPTEIYYVVYEGDALTGDYDLIQQTYVPSSGTGEAWYSSGSINVPMLASKYYFVGMTYIGNITWGMDDDASPLPLSFGTFETDVLGIVAFPPPPTITNAVTNQGAVKQAIVTSNGPVDWLSASHDVGSLAPESTELVSLTANASTLSPGSYQTYLCIHSVDYEEPVIIVPVDLTVLDVTDALIPVQEGWNFVSVPLIPGDTILPDVLLDGDGDTSWTTVTYFDQGTWSAWSAFKPPSLNDLNAVHETMGVWLYVEVGSLGDGFIKVSGVAPTGTVIDLLAGWNMIGYPATDDSTYDVDNLIADTGATSVEGFSAVDPYHIEPLAGTYVLKRGEAYWINVNSDTAWTINW